MSGMFYLLLLRGIAIAAATSLLATPDRPEAPRPGAEGPRHASSLAAADAPAQEGERPARRPAAEEDEDPPLLASDGEPALPGRVPADTPEATKEAWQSLASTLTVPRPEAPDGAQLSFQIAAAVRHRDEESGTKDFRARVSYLDSPVAYVELETLDDEGRTISVEMRGPDPARPQLARRVEYWYRKDRGEGTTDGWVNLSGSDFKSSRDKVDRAAVASFNIARILTPHSMRLTSLETLAPAEEYDPEQRFLRLGDDPGVRFPDVDILGVQGGAAQKVAELAKGLRWIEVRTPDFRLFEDGLTNRQREALRAQVKRVAIGVAPEASGESLDASRPLLVIVSPSATGPLQVPGSLLIQCTEWFRQDAAPEVILPGRFYAYETVESPTSPTGLAFSGTTTADLFLLEGCKIGAGLTPASFMPGK